MAAAAYATDNPLQKSGTQGWQCPFDSPLDLLVDQGIDEKDSPATRFEKKVTIHLYVCLMVLLPLNVMGWSTVAALSVFIFVFLGCAVGGIVRYAISDDHTVPRLIILFSGTLFEWFLFFSEGCRPLETSAGRVLVLITPTASFHTILGGDFRVQAACLAAHFFFYVFASILEASNVRCFTPDPPGVTNAHGLYFVQLVLPVAVTIGFLAWIIHDIVEGRAGERRRTEFAERVLKAAAINDYESLKKAALQYDQEALEFSVEDDALIRTLGIVDGLQQLIGSRSNPRLSRIFSSVSLKDPSGTPPRGSKKQLLDEAEERILITINPEDNEGSSDRSSLKDDGKKRGAAGAGAGAGAGGARGGSFRSVTSGDTANPQSLNLEASGAKAPSTPDKSATGASQEGHTPFARAGHARQSRLMSSFNLGPPSPLGAVRRAAALTIELATLGHFSLPLLRDYVNRPGAHQELLQLLLTEYVDNVQKAIELFHGVVINSHFSSVLVKFENPNEAFAASIYFLQLMKRDERHQMDPVIKETMAMAPFVIVLHAQVAHGFAGSNVADMLSVGHCAAENVFGAILSMYPKVAVMPPVILTSRSLGDSIEDGFFVKHGPSNQLSIVQDAKQKKPDGTPIAPLTVSFSEKAFAMPDFSDLTAEIAGNLFSSSAPRSRKSLASEESGNLTSSPSTNVSANSSGSMIRKRRKLPAEVMEIWNRFDADKNGYLDIDEIRDLVAGLGIEMEPAELQNFFDEVDKDRSGTLTMDEFRDGFFGASLGGAAVMSNIRRAAVAMARSAGTDNLPVVLNAWKKYDKDGSGTLDADELGELLKDLGMPTGKEEVNWMVEHIDRDGNGVIEFEEFIALFSDSDRKLNSVKARIETVTRVMSNRENTVTYSTPKQTTRDRLMELKWFVETVYLIPLLLYITYNALIVSWRSSMGNYLTVSTSLIAVDMVLDLIYIAWFVLKILYIPREVKGQVVFEYKDIMSHLIRTAEFYVDVLVVLPVDFIYIGLGDNSNRGVIGYYRLNKVLALYHFDTLLQLLCRQLDPSATRVIAAMIYFFGFAHIFACATVLVAINEGPAVFGDQVGMDTLTASNESTYTLALYLGITTMSGQVRGDPVPASNTVLWLMVVSCLLALPMFTVIIATISNAMTNETNETKFLDKLDAVRGFCEYANLPPQLEEEIVSFYRHLYNTTGSLDIAENPLNDVPVELQVPITVEIGNQMLSKVPIFAEAIKNVEFVYELTQMLVPKVIEPKTIVIRKNDRGTNMYFITFGDFNIIIETGLVVFTLRKGNFFGEIALLHNVKRTATIECGNRYGNVLVLDKVDWDEVVKTFPQCLTQVYKAAEDRIKQLLDKEAEDAKKAKEERKKARLEKRRMEASQRGETLDEKPGNEDDSSSDDEKDAKDKSKKRNETIGQNLLMQFSKQGSIHKSDSIKELDKKANSGSSLMTSGRSSKAFEQERDTPQSPQRRGDSLSPVSQTSQDGHRHRRERAVSFQQEPDHPSAPPVTHPDATVPARRDSVAELLAAPVPVVQESEASRSLPGQVDEKSDTE